MRALLRPRAAHAPDDRGFTLVEVLAAIVVLAIAFAALAAALVSGMVATSRASQNTEAKQIAARQIESLHSVKWSLLGLYQNEVGSAWGTGLHNGESIVRLAGTAPSPRPADAPSPTKVVSGHGGKQYTVTTWVTWAGSSVASPNDGTTYAKKRLWVNVSYTPRGGSSRTVHVEDYRAPTPLEMLPPASSPIIPITLANPIFTPSGQQLNSSNTLPAAESILVDTTTIGTDVTAVVTTSSGTPISIALVGDATAKHWTGTLPAGSGPFNAGSLTVTFTAHNSSGVVATGTGTINLTAYASAPAFALTGAVSTPVSQVLNTNNTIAQAITVSVGTTAAASGVSLQWKLADGTIVGPKTMTASGSTWTYTIPAGSGPFVPGNVLFTMTGTAAAGGTASATSTVTLAATSLGAISIANVSWSPNVCVDTTTTQMWQATDFTIEVKNVAATDTVAVAFDSLGYFPTTSTAGKKLGPNGGYLFTVTLASGTKVPPPSFDFNVTVHRAADNTTSTPYYKTVTVTSATKKNNC